LIRRASFNPDLNNSSDFDRAFSCETTAKMFPIAVPPKIKFEEAKIKCLGSKVDIFLLYSYLRSSIFYLRLFVTVFIRFRELRFLAPTSS
jgi:hypothetical protein